MADEPTQAEKLAALHNDRRVRDATFADVVDLYSPSPGGRFATLALPTVEVPRLPEGSPWHHDAVGVEPPLGFSVNAMEPVGEPHEVEAAARRLEAAAGPAAPISASSSASVVGAASPIRRRV
jgi:hypothetical protein